MYPWSRLDTTRILLMSVVLFSCSVTHHTQPFQAGQALEPTTEGEKRLWHSAAKAETTFIKSKRIHHDPGLRDYLQAVMDRLFPEFDGKIRVKMIKDPNFRAFALPNGSVYVSTGLLAALDNEAQLATVLAHEGIHFINRHAAIQKANVSVGISRPHEKEADLLGRKRVLAAGYDVRQAHEIFRYVSVQEKVYWDVTPEMPSLHPPTKERIRYFQSLNASTAHHSNKMAETAYRQHVDGLRQTVLQEKLETGHYDEIIAVLTDKDLASRYGETGRFYLAEAYRLRDREDDHKKAIIAYHAAIESCPDFAPTYRSLGMVYLKSKKFKDAAEFLGRYMALEPAAEDKAFVEQYLKQARYGGNEE